MEITDRENIISAFEDYEPYAHDLPAVTMKSRVYLDALALLKEQEAIVHPEPSCEMTYITDCCCDLCGVQLIREDNFCRRCGKRIEWEGR